MKPQRQYLTNARVILSDETLPQGAVLIDDGHIVAIDPDGAMDAREFDLGGRTLMPGMIDLHCDALEKEVEPRPNVHFPLDFAAAQADKRNAAAGVTTIFHALSFANAELGVRNNAFAAQVARAVHAWQPHALVDNRVHARYEITDPTAQEVLESLLAKDELHLLSFMDHTPGQGQFKDIDAYRSYLSRTYRKDAAELDTILDAKRAAADGAIRRMQSLAEVARQCGVSIASHDDDSPEKIDIMRTLGAAISEFPINIETARAAKAKGIYTLFGAPNVLRGKSQSGSMRAVDAVLAGVADCLCGDYSPAALLPAVMKLPELAGISLHDAVRLVTANPARAAGLADRGEIAPSKRADLIAIRQLGGLPHVEQVWVKGVRTYSTLSGHA
jgi:alpha-D-ribose 1-methylphosphonate 5-triphosphate diphosphatase